MIIETKLNIGDVVWLYPHIYIYHETINNNKINYDNRNKI